MQLTIAEKYVKRFDSKWNLDPKTGCWNWAACRDRNGYGRGGFEGETRLAHRVSWMIVFGRLSSEVFLCHRCDNTSCVNPAHLFTGTQADNMEDMFAKGRAEANICIIYVKQTHCKRGHSLAGSKHLVRASGERVCRACHNERNRAYYWRVAGIKRNQTRKEERKAARQGGD